MFNKSPSKRELVESYDALAKYVVSLSEDIKVLRNDVATLAAALESAVREIETGLTAVTGTQADALRDVSLLQRDMSETTGVLVSLCELVVDLDVRVGKLEARRPAAKKAPAKKAPAKKVVAKKAPAKKAAPRKKATA